MQISHAPLKLSLLIGLFFFVFFGFAQKMDLSFNHLTIDDGLSNSIVQDIFQDSRGYIWIATIDGLNRYDGYEFKVFRNERNDSSSISSNRTVSIVEDKEGDLIISTWEAGFCVYNYKNGTFTNYKNQPDNPKSLPVNRIRQIVIDKQGRIWLASIEGGLIRFNKKTGDFISYKPPKFKGAGQIRSLFVQSDGRIIVPYTGGGVYLFNPYTEEFTSPPDKSSGKNIHQSTASKYVYQSSDQKIWIGTEGDGVYVYNPQKQESKHYTHNPLDPKSLGSNVVRDIIEDKKGNIWLATDGGGLNRFIKENESFESYVNDMINPKSLSTNQLYKLYLDRSNIFWIGTFSGGLNMYNPNEQKFKTYKPLYGDPNSLSYKSVLSIFQDKDRNIWIGTDGGGLNLYNPLKYGEKFIHFLNDKKNSNSLISNIVKTIYQDRDGIMWFGTYQAGLDRYDPLSKKFTHISPNGQTDGMPSSLVWALLEDSRGNFWVSCLSTGVSKMDKNKFTFKTYKPGTEPGSISHATVMVIYEDRQKRVWFGTEGGGLNLYHPEKDNFTSFRYSGNDQNSISHNDIRALYQDSKNNLWIGTNGGGLNMLSPDLKKFEHFTINNGLPSNAIFGILEDDDGNLWLSTTNGLSKFNPLKKTFRNYDKFDGLQSNEFTYTASCKTSEGHLLFGGIEGFNMFKPSEIRDNITIPPVYITELLIFNNPVNPGDYHNLLSVPIDQTKEIRLPSKYSVFTLRFTALNYTHTIKNRYAYYLENFETKWNEVGNKREATYTNLDPGTYYFHVRACNNDGIWNLEGASLKIIIDPPWYQSNLAKLIYVALSILFISALALYLIYIFKRQKRKMEIEKKRKLNAQKRQFEEEAMKAEREILELMNQKLENELYVLEQKKILNEKNEQLRQEQLKAEKEILNLHQEKLKNEISFKTNKLASLALHYAHKNEILISIKEDLKKVPHDNLELNSQMVKKIINSIETDLDLDENWSQFELHFDEVHENFLKRFREKYPDLRPIYLKLSAYIRMKLSSKQIAALMNTSLASVEKNRHRLKEKLNLDEGIKLSDYIEKF
jgi:ligand-binding sensor domain-containing protein